MEGRGNNEGVPVSNRDALAPGSGKRGQGWWHSGLRERETATRPGDASHPGH
jgi:hypothetical protein